jgi:hypothetical protein
MPLGTIGTIKFRKQSTAPENTAFDISGNEERDSFVIASAVADGAILARDRSAPDGWSFIVGAGTGTVTHVSGALTLGNVIVGNGGADINDSGVLLSAVARQNISNTFTSFNSFPGGFSTDGSAPGAGNARVSGSLAVVGTTTFSGAVTLTNTLTVNTFVNLLGATVIQSSLNVQGLMSATGQLIASGGFTTQSGGANPGAGNANIQGALTVQGLAGFASGVNIAALTVTGSSILGNISIGSANLTDSTAVPTIAGGFGTGATVVGRGYAFAVFTGTTASTSGVVNFNTTYAAAVAVVGSNSTAVLPITLTVTTTGLTVSYGSSTAAYIYFLVRGF